MAEIDQEIEVLINDQWVRGTVVELHGNEIQVVLRQRNSPITQRKQSEKGVTWREPLN